MKPTDFKIGKTYKTTTHVHACLEGNDGDCTFTDQVDLEPNTNLVFDGMGDVETTLRFHSEDGTEYHLHHEDLDSIEELPNVPYIPCNARNHV